MVSRFIDKDDWSLNPEVFRSLDARWGPHTVDRFCYFNSQVVRFNSKYFSSGSSAIDASGALGALGGWSADNNWLCPPVRLIVSASKHLRYHKGAGTLIVPE